MANKMTQKDFFNEIIALAEANGRDDIVEFAEGRIEALNKKTANRKASATSEENVRLMGIVVDELAKVDKATVSELMKANPELGELSNQKVSSLLKTLKESDKVVKTMDKKKAYFSLA